MLPARTAIHPESYYNGEKTYRIAFEKAFKKARAAEVGIELIGLYYMGLDEDIHIPNNITMYSTSGAVITSIIPTGGYRGIFGTDKDDVANVRISGIHFKNIVGEGVAALNFNLTAVHSVNNLIVENCEAEGCSLIRLNGGGRNILVRNNYIHSPVKQANDSVYSRAVQISRNSTSAVHDGVSIEGNVITGNWTHGIEIMGDPISTGAQDPTLPKKARNVTVTGNRVVAESREYSFGGIFLSGVEEAVVAHNHVENYGDVGIDFEGSRNCIAIGNTLKNNNKNMALFGNSKSIMFTRNSSYISVNDEALLHFYNTVSEKKGIIKKGTIVDTRNTDIVLDGNMFCTDPFDYSEGTGRIQPGTAGKVTIARNKFINSFVYAVFFDLAQLSIIDNEFDVDYRERSFGDLPIYVSPLRIKADRQPAWRYDILRNKVTVRNAATRMAMGSRSQNAPILALIMDHADADSIVDYHLNISDNEVIDVTGGVWYGINVADLSVNTGVTFYGTIVGNRGVDEIRYPARKAGQRAHVMNISGNTGVDGQPYKITAPNNREIYSWDTTVLDSSGQVLELEVPDGLYVGQTKLIVMQAAGDDANVTILRHATSSPELARFTGTGPMPQMLELLWTGTVWETLRATCSFP
ncbi:MAG TPA: right-handed parallel beta-helix repeat-containing protein [Pyrinomonadaceae bacterium]|nr:right-handed parallel beta-helix repeat-containing protein [Pyrinomonadaceae bacterium]